MNLHRLLPVSLHAFTLAIGAQPALAEGRMPPRIECEVVIPCAATEAWAAWTTAKGLESFLARTAKVTPEEGGPYVLDLGGGNPGELASSRPPRVIHIDAPRSLSFEWVIPLPQAAARDPMTVVTIHIEPVSTHRCRVRLEHTGWAIGEEATESFAYSRKSWKILLRNLRSALTRGRG